ncbi:MAG: HD family phosphohydrolase [Opitutales bacterium]
MVIGRNRMARRRLEKNAPGHRHRPLGDPSRTTQYFQTSQVVGLALFFGFTALIVLICFVGRGQTGPTFLENQLARVRIVADFGFTYTSRQATEEKIQRVRRQVPPVYRLTLEPVEAFEAFLEDLLDSLPVLELQIEDLPPDEREAAIAAFASTFRTESGFAVPAESLQTLLRSVPQEERRVLIEEGLTILRDLYEAGLYEPEGPAFGGGELKVFSVIDETGSRLQMDVQPVAEAAFSLRQRLAPLGPFDVARALYALFRTGLQPNLVYDEAGTQAAIAEAESRVEPVTVEVPAGTVLIEPGSVVTAADRERLAAYRRALAEREEGGLLFDGYIFDRTLITLGILFSAILYLRLALPSLVQHNNRLALVAIVLLLSLAGIRLIFELGDNAVLGGDPALRALLPYMTPVALAGIMICVMLGTHEAVFGTLLISLFFAVMQGTSMDPFFIAFFSGLVGVYVCRDVRKRSAVVRAGAIAGLMTAACAAFLGLLNEIGFTVLLWQILAALGAGILTGILAVGLLPLFESLFKFTTQITLLELTDYNHPLLRRMQLEAPGSYHHSLMVASLSENAAAQIGANPLVCRVCALFHDIGKLVKPDYFTENQREGTNPHLSRNPSMSALVIKSHVKEGVILARQFKLPRIIIDVIRQHHGTSLIQYFYYAALKKRDNAQQELMLPNMRGQSHHPFPDAPRIQVEAVDESTYRYDGPRPRFVESAIIHFADSVEAASRSLKKVTQPAVEELLDRIFMSRLEDGQLDECPITYREITQIKRSFAFTLMNMLHSRVEYPKDKDSIPEDKPESEQAASDENAEEADASGKEQKPTPAKGND